MTNDTDIGEEINVRLLREELWFTSGTLMTRLCCKFQSLGSISHGEKVGPKLLKIQLQLKNHKIWRGQSSRSATDYVGLKMMTVSEI